MISSELLRFGKKLYVLGLEPLKPLHVGLNSLTANADVGVAEANGGNGEARSPQRLQAERFSDFAGSVSSRENEFAGNTYV